MTTMSKHPRRTSPLLAIVAAVLLLTPACANKTKPLQTITITHDALATAQDLEVNLCLGAANTAAAAALPAVNHCTTALARQIGLTDAIHQSIQSQLATAFALHKSITQQLANGATKVDLAGLQATITAILGELAKLQAANPQVAQLTTTVKGAQIR